MTDLTPAETKAIAALQKLAKTWPKSLWLHCLEGQLDVVKRLPDGSIARKHVPSQTGGYGADNADPDYVVAHIKGIYVDGGEW